MNLIETRLPGVLILEPRVFRDDRGYFLETWNQARYEALGLPGRFVQDNVSFSAHGVLRGLHYQHPQAQGKLVTVLQGEVLDVAVDIRTGSPTFGQWVGVTLSDANQREFYVPAGYAHGFLVTGPSALFSYKCTDYYSPHGEGSVLWNDPEIGIAWPAIGVVLSAKDQAAPRLAAIAPERLPRYEPPAGGRRKTWIADSGAPAASRASVTRVPEGKGSPLVP